MTMNGVPRSGARPPDVQAVDRPCRDALLVGVRAERAGNSVVCPDGIAAGAGALSVTEAGEVIPMLPIVAGHCCGSREVWHTGQDSNPLMQRFGDAAPIARGRYILLEYFDSS